MDKIDSPGYKAEQQRSSHPISFPVENTVFPSTSGKSCLLFVILQYSYHLPAGSSLHATYSECHESRLWDQKEFKERQCFAGDTSEKTELDGRIIPTSLCNNLVSLISHLIHKSRFIFNAHSPEGTMLLKFPFYKPFSTSTICNGSQHS